MNIVDTEKFNSNNAWGFGGGIGTETTYDNDLVQRKGTAYYRHAKPENFERWFVIVDKDFRIELGRKPKAGDVVCVYACTEGHHVSSMKELSEADIEKLNSRYSEYNDYKLIKKIQIN